MKPWWRLLSVTFFLLGGLPLAQAARVTYSETLSLEWGKVTFMESGQETTEPVWFTRTAPTFAQGGILSVAQQACLKSALESCAGHLGTVAVWRMDGSLSGDFLARILAEHCLPGGNISLGSKPADWEDGEKKRTWNFVLRYEADSPAPSAVAGPPAVELALLVDEVPAGVAWSVNVARAIDDPAVETYAALPAPARATLGKNAAWMQLFLVAPESLRPGAFPRVEPLPEGGKWAIPVAFGLAALAEIPAVLGEDRSFRESSSNALAARLAPGSAKAFPGAHRWFPEVEASRHALDRTEVETGKSPVDLFRLGVPSGSSFGMERVLPAVNEWALRVGPFRRVQPAIVRVDKVRGTNGDLAVEALKKSASPPEAVLRDVATEETNLARVVSGFAVGTGDFFWLPGLAERHAKAMREVETTRFASAVHANFENDRFVYLATYAPASISGKLGVSYNPEELLGAAAEAGWTDFIRPGDALALKASWAERAVVGSLDYKLPYLRSVDRLTHYQLEILGDAGRDEHFRLGGASPGVFDRRSRSIGLEHEIRHETGRLDWVARDALLWDDHELTKEAIPGSQRDSGLTFRHRQLWVFRPDPAGDLAPRWEFTLAPSITYSPRVGWDRAFWTGELHANTKVAFGGTETEARPMAVEFQFSVGASTAGIPVALTYRLGDNDRLFGLEPGEKSGRSYSHGAASYSVEVGHLLAGLFKGPDGAGGMPSALQGMSLQVLAEAGTVARDGGWAVLDGPDHVVSSYGLALEKATPELGASAGFRLGYAWSPDSLRTHGRVFTAANWSF